MNLINLTEIHSSSNILDCTLIRVFYVIVSLLNGALTVGVMNAGHQTDPTLSLKVCTHDVFKGMYSLSI